MSVVAQDTLKGRLHLVRGPLQQLQIDVVSANKRAGYVVARGASTGVKQDTAKRMRSVTKGLRTVIDLDKVRNGARSF